MKIKRRMVENEIARRAMTYKEAATAAGITEKTLKAARAGAEIRTTTAGRIATVLGLPINELIESEEDQ